MFFGLIIAASAKAQFLSLASTPQGLKALLPRMNAGASTQGLKPRFLWPKMQA
jgi:hypothetical protein